MLRMKQDGPTAEPCTTLAVIAALLEVVVMSLVLCDRSDKKSQSQLYGSSGRSSTRNWSVRALCLTVSKAFVKSRAMMCTYGLVVRWCPTVWRRSTRAAMVEPFGRKAY